ncbi:sirohydrochlorin chelatase [Streptomyces anulatus]|uniref:sirohydrochlorin chelatase n=1 Tax=Streptomyces anulatus TaxID=1892 RepID=UPI00386FCD05
MTEPSVVLAVCGHEAARGEELERLLGPGVTAVSGGRALYRALAARPEGAAAVVPMTLGREPGLVADAARTVRSLPTRLHRGVVLTEPFGNAEHLAGWLRAAANTVPASSALLVSAPSGDPFEDAELFRIARLVRCHGRHRLVEVAFTGGDPDPAEGVRRCALLGATRVALLTAAFTGVEPPEPPPGVEVVSSGPLLSPAALARVAAARVAAARERLREHGDDGVARALTAADHHGYNHTHPPGSGHSHAPGHRGHEHRHDDHHGHEHRHDHHQHHEHDQRQGRLVPPYGGGASHIHPAALTQAGPPPTGTRSTP